MEQVGFRVVIYAPIGDEPFILTNAHLVILCVRHTEGYNMIELYNDLHARVGVPRTLVRWRTFEQTLWSLSEVRQWRFLQEATYASPNLRFINVLLSNSGDLSFFTHGSDEDWYDNDFLPAESFIRQQYDPVLTHRTFRSLFYQNTARSREYLIDINYRDPLKQLPLGQPWTEDPTEAQQYAPVQLLYHDSPELVWHLFRDAIMHRAEPPGIAFIGINLDQLILSWRQYLRAGHSPNTMAAFHHQYVIFPFHKQLLEMWIFNLVSDLIEHRYSGRSSMNVLDEYRRTGIPSNLKQGVQELEKMIDQVFLYEVRLGDFLHTPIFFHQSLIDRLHTLLFKQRISPLRQYFYLMFLSEYPLLKALLILLKAQPQTGLNDRMLKRAKLWLTRIGSTNMRNVPGDEASYALMKTCYEHLQHILA